jgi:hypothetical protein
MVTLLTALDSLVDQWKQHVGPGVPMDQVVGKFGSALGAQMLKMTSDSPTRRIVSAIDSALTAHSYAAVDAADDLADQYGSKKNLLAETTLEAFLLEIWPKAPRKARPNGSQRTGATTGLTQMTV